MIRYGRRFEESGNFGWQVGFGPGLSLANKLKPRLSIGGGLYAGQKQKILSDTGISIGSVERLSKVFNTRTSYTERPTDTSISRTTVGVYFSLSCLFGL